MTTTPPLPAISQPPVQPAPTVGDAAPSPQRRFSERQRLANLANQSGTKSAAQKAVEVKLQWLGLDGEQVHHKAEKKKMKQCLDMYTGSAKQTAESALHDLLLNGAGVNSQ